MSTSNSMSVGSLDCHNNFHAASPVTRLLIIDRDPPPSLRAIGEQFPDSYVVDAVRGGAAALASILSIPPDVIFLDPQLPNESGFALYGEIRRMAPQVPVIFLISSATADLAIQAMKHGAYDCLFKPLEEGEVERVLRAAMEIAPHRSGQPVGDAVRAAAEADGALFGACPAMREVYKSIGLVAGQDVNVIITGESGTGKEVVARAIIRHSSRSDAPFLAINCAAIPENLLESELFGHEKGAFSGAERRRIGKFEQYNGGTILLDEIGDMPLALQAKILRLLQEQTFERVGGNETITTNVRLIASTHRDLRKWAAEGKFRSDLYYRLSVFTIHLPPLRDRGEDLPALVNHFVGKYSRELGKETRDIAPDAMERLRQYAWPGNIRELQSVLKQALLRSSGKTLMAAFLPLSPGVSPCPRPTSAPSIAGFDIDSFLSQRLNADANNLYADLHRELDRHSLAKVMTYTRGNRHMASRVLGIARQTLRLKLRESGLHITQSVGTDLPNAESDNVRDGLLYTIDCQPG